MPKQSYGPVSQGRARSLLFALLDFANDCLEADERELERLRSQLETHWQTPHRLVVRTQLRFLHRTTVLANPDEKLTQAHIKTALKHLTSYIDILEDNRTVTRGSDRWHFTINFWCDRWDRDGNIQAFDRAWGEARSGSATVSRTQQTTKSTEWQQSEVRSESDRWLGFCREALSTRLTSNPLTAGDGMAFEVGEVYVPLGVVAGQREEGDGDEVESYEPEELLERYLDSESPCRVAIVGEPGAGKTTLLQQLALGLCESGGRLPVWVSLADVDGRSLEDYLTTTWLKQVLKQFLVPEETVAEFAQLVEQGGVWLLLDAVDEMGGSGSEAISQIKRELRGWLGNAAVVLTCRSTVWDSGKNALEYFDTYRCRSFSDRGTEDGIGGTNQVHLFIQRWFIRTPELGDRLCRELDRRTNSRIRDVSRHPLYLTLLCRTWQLTQGQLPATKAILYRQFVDALYDWKQEAFPTSRKQRQQLNRTLAGLALQAMQQSPPKFRWRQGELQTWFDAIDPDLMTLALQLGWLDVVGRSPETGEKSFAFYHPTFQEYFAASAITDGQQLITYETNTGKVYPIFEPQWQEVILLWLGREDVAAAQKERFLQTLDSWQDQCGGLYEVRSRCLVAKGLAEFSEYSQAEQVITDLVHWRFATPKQGPKRPSIVIEQAGIALSRSDRTLTVPALEHFLETHTNPVERWLAAHSLGKNHDPGNAIAITTLEELLTNSTDAGFTLNLCRSLGAMSPEHPQVHQTLETLLTTHPKPTIRRKAALRLGKLSPKHPLAVKALISILDNTDDLHLRGNTLDTLRQIYPGHPLVPFEEPEPSKSSSRQKRSQSDPEKEMAYLLERLESVTKVGDRLRLVTKVASYDPTLPQASKIPLEALGTARTKSSLKLVVELLRNAGEGDRLREFFPVVRDLYLQPEAAIIRKHACYKLLWHWSKVLSYPEFQALWVLKT